MVKNAEYEQALVAVNREVTHLLAERNQLTKELALVDERLSQLRTTHEALTKLLGAAKITQVPHLDAYLDQVVKDIGISDAIRKILANAVITMSPNEVKLALAEAGFDLTGYANPGAVVHNTLLRLEKQGEIVRINSAYISAPKPKSLGERIAEMGPTRNLGPKIRYEKAREKE